MGKESRLKTALPETMLHRQDVPAVAVLALMDALTIDGMWTVKSSPVSREMREYRERLLTSIKTDVERLHGTYKGRVTDGLITHCDRYLCRVQDALDTFFEDITEEDLAEIVRVKSNWPIEGRTDVKEEAQN